MCQQKESKCKNRENNDAQLFNMHKYPTSTNVSNTAQKILACNWCGSDISCIQYINLALHYLDVKANYRTMWEVWHFSN